ncbi:MAG TPA: hypothetical protein PKK83_13790, partial [Polyangiaceae bacterium]|nr:hypothetical protein [Polyangiaceae bacterium]
MRYSRLPLILSIGAIYAAFVSGCGRSDLDWEDLDPSLLGQGGTDPEAGGTGGTGGTGGEGGTGGIGGTG